jgi:hypothetical protein
LDALTPLHPNHLLLADIDRRLASLAALHERVDARAGLPLPPATVEQPLPVSTPLPSAPTVTRDAPDAGDLDSLAQEYRKRHLRHQQQRRFDREFRQLKQQYASALDETQHRIQSEADAALREVDARFANDMLNADLGEQTAQRFAANWPADARAQKVLASAREKAAHTRTQYDAARSAVEAAYAVRREEAVEDNARHLDAAREALWRALSAETQRALDREPASSTAPDLTFAPPSAITFAELPAEVIALDLPGLAPALSSASDRGDTATRRAFEQIDTSRQRLLAARREIARAIDTDTRAVIRSVATQHGFIVHTDASHGEEMTAQVRLWLQEYWPEAANK